MSNKLEILYEDNHVLVVVKPIGVLSQEDSSGKADMVTLLKEYLRVTYHKPGNVYLGLIHRLDKDVGGVMVFAKTSKAAKRLSEQIKNHQIQKIYLAVVNGHLPKKGTFVDYIKRQEYRSIISDESHGKIARLSYRVLKERHSCSLVEIKLETGRHHQIRIQFASRGNFLLGDKKYGKNFQYPLALYATSLSFYHPISKEFLQFQSNIPKSGHWKQFTE